MIFIDGAPTARAMKSLETKGFIQREKCSGDHRANDIRLTAKGRDIQPVIVKTLGKWTDIISRGLNERDRDWIIQTLMSMSQNALKATRGEWEWGN